MKKNKNYEQELQKSKIMLLILLLLIFLVVIIVSLQKAIISQNENKIGSNLIPENITIEEGMTEEDVKEIKEEVEQLSKESETIRIKYYLTKYIGYIENEEYEKAYNVLYPEFKKNYFPALEKYTEYVKRKYTSFVTVDYEDMQRQGNIYIIYARIQDLSNPTNEEKNFSQKFVIQEQEINKFVISFEVVE